MTREMQKAIKRNKENAALLVRYANPQSKSKPTDEEVLAILYRHILYCGTVRPVITGFSVSRFNRNKIIKCAYFVVVLDNGESYQISAYQNLTGRTPEEKEADKTAQFPSGLVTIFHDKIKSPEAVAEPAAEPAETESTTASETDTTPKTQELKPVDGRKSFYGKAVVMQEADGSRTLYSYNTPIIKRTPTGELVKLWDGWTVTTGRHIKAFCGLDKAGYMALPLEERDKPTGGSGGRTLTNAESYAAMIGRRAAGRAAMV